MDDKRDRKKDIRHYLNGIYTQEEAQSVLDMIKNDEDRDILEQNLYAAWTDTEELMPTEEEEKLFRKEVRTLVKQDRKEYIMIPRKYLRIFMSVAAVVAVIVSVVGYRYFVGPYAEEVSYVSLATLYNENKEVVLPDGTHVMLNACSSISYPEKFTGDQRDVRLDGEAFFKVARNEKQPFVVNLENLNVKVLGTEFNIKAYKGDIIQMVSVESGKVQVDMPEAMVRLVASEQLNVNVKTQEYVKSKGVNRIAAWRKGDLQFNKTPIHDVAHELERIYHVKIIFEPGEVFSNVITGIHPNSGLESVLSSVASATNIRFRYFEEKGEVYIYKRD